MPKLIHKIDHKKITFNYHEKLSCLIDAINRGKTFLTSQNKVAIYKAIYELGHITPGSKASLPIQLLLLRLRTDFFKGYKTHDGLKELVSYITNIPDEGTRQEVLLRSLNQESAICFLFNISDAAVSDTQKIFFYRTIKNYFIKEALPKLTHALRQLEAETPMPTRVSKISGSFFDSHTQDSPESSADEEPALLRKLS